MALDIDIDAFVSIAWTACLWLPDAQH